MIKPGIYTDLSSDDYHGDKESISRSALMDFKKSPKLYWANHINPDRPAKEPTKAMTFGSAFHCWILEPELFGNQYAPLPAKVLLKDVGREIYDNHKNNTEMLEKSGRVIISSDEWILLRHMSSALKGHKKAWGLIEGGVYESSYIWQDRHSGLMVKARPDILNLNCYIDLKTIDDASPQSYQRAMVTGGYHTQAAMVMDGYEQLTGERLSAAINICIEKTYPYSIGIYIIDEAAIEAGHMEFKQLLLDLKDCIHDNTFSDYPSMTIGLPKWAL